MPLATVPCGTCGTPGLPVVYLGLVQIHRLNCWCHQSFVPAGILWARPFQHFLPWEEMLNVVDPPPPRHFPFLLDFSTSDGS